VASGRAPVVRRASETAAQVQSTSIILEAADRAASTVAALVDYSRGPEVVQDQSVDPARELETLITLYYGIAKKGVEVVREFEPGVLVLGDRDKLNQVWVNLINNALQAMNQKGRLVLRTRSTPQGIEVAVANNGPPIAPQLQAKIFQPFFTTKKAGEGTGLGLDICRRIVEAHQGTLVLSQEGVYTVFTVTLPAPPQSLL
jgi:signal transduction histidine kinase